MTVMIAGTEAPKVEAGMVRTAGAIRATEAMGQAGMPAGDPVAMAIAVVTAAHPALVGSDPLVLVAVKVIVQAADTAEGRSAIVHRVDTEATILMVRNPAVLGVTGTAAGTAAVVQVDPADSIVEHRKPVASIVGAVTALPAIAVPPVGIGRAGVSVATVPVVHTALPTGALQIADRQIVDPEGKQKAGTAVGRAPVVTVAAATQTEDRVEMQNPAVSPPAARAGILTAVDTAAIATARTVPQVAIEPLGVADLAGLAGTPREMSGQVAIARAVTQIAEGSVAKVVSAQRMPRAAADTATVGRPGRSRVATAATVPMTVAVTVLPLIVLPPIVLPPIVPTQIVDPAVTEIVRQAMLLVAIEAVPVAIGRPVIVPTVIGRPSVASEVGTEALSPAVTAEANRSTVTIEALGHHVTIAAGTTVIGMIAEATIVRGMTGPGTIGPGTTVAPDRAARTRTDRPGSGPSTTAADAIDRRALHVTSNARRGMTVRRGTTGARSKTAHVKTASHPNTVKSGRRSVEI